MVLLLHYSPGVLSHVLPLPAKYAHTSIDKIIYLFTMSPPDVGSLPSEYRSDDPAPDGHPDDSLHQSDITSKTRHPLDGPSPDQYRRPHPFARGLAFSEAHIDQFLSDTFHDSTGETAADGQDHEPCDLEVPYAPDTALAAVSAGCAMEVHQATPTRDFVPGELWWLAECGSESDTARDHHLYLPRAPEGWFAPDMAG